MYTRPIEIMMSNSEDATTFDEGNTYIRVEDLAGGEFISISQDNDSEFTGKIAFELDEWEDIKTAIDDFIKTLKQ